MGIKLHIIKGIKLAKWKTIPGIASGVNSKNGNVILVDIKKQYYPKMTKNQT